jgi:hypothetical protein
MRAMAGLFVVRRLPLLGPEEQSADLCHRLDEQARGKTQLLAFIATFFLIYLFWTLKPDFDFLHSFIFRQIGFPLHVA